MRLGKVRPSFSVDFPSPTLPMKGRVPASGAGEIVPKALRGVALVEETNAAIEQTEAQVTALDQIVASFLLDEEEPPHHRRSAA